jgi:hypothetical protein
VAKAGCVKDYEPLLSEEGRITGGAERLRLASAVALFLVIPTVDIASAVVCP